MGNTCTVCRIGTLKPCSDDGAYICSYCSIPKLSRDVPEMNPFRKEMLRLRSGD